MRYDEIGRRLKAFRLGEGLSADEVARRLDISRTALYRFERGGLIKIDTLERLAELLNVSVPTLLGVGIEYVHSAVTYFERLRQLEETVEHIVILAGPISFLLASDEFGRTLEEVLIESIPDYVSDRDRKLADIQTIMDLLWSRKEVYLQRRPAVINLISAVDIERFLRNGFIGRPYLSQKANAKRHDIARREIEHFASLVEDSPMGIQIGIVTETLPHTGYQIFRQPDLKTLTISPFRLGEQPNIRIGVAMITSAPEAVALHEETTREMWQHALKGKDGASYMQKLIKSINVKV